MTQMKFILRVEVGLVIRRTKKKTFFVILETEEQDVQEQTMAFEREIYLSLIPDKINIEMIGYEINYSHCSYPYFCHKLEVSSTGSREVLDCWYNEGRGYKLAVDDFEDFERRMEKAGWSRVDSGKKRQPIVFPPYEPPIPVEAQADATKLLSQETQLFDSETKQLVSETRLLSSETQMLNSGQES